MKKLDNKSLSAFTLIELLIAMTIFFMVVMGTYLPYNYYQNKANLRQSTKEISQSLYEARNMAINGTSSGSNLSIGIYFDSSINSKNTIKFLSYPHSFTGAQITKDIGGDINIIRSFELQPGVEIDSIESHKNGLFFFEAITGKASYYYWDSSDMKKDIITDKIKINFSYKGSTSPKLQKEIKYFTETNIVDY